MDPLKKQNHLDKAPTTSAERIPYALRLLLILTLAIILAESRHLINIPILDPDMSETLDSVLHILLTTILVFPVLYLISYRPLLHQIVLRAEAEEKLKQAHEETEQRVVERTSELTAANLTLQNEIQERQRVEQHLLLQTAAVESAANGIVITDKQGIIEWCNPAFTRMTGYEYTEALGHNFLTHDQGQTLPGIQREIWANLLAGISWQGEITSRRKDGSQYIEEQTITPVKDKDGQVSHFVAIKNDITERKQAERALQSEQKRLFSLLNHLPAIVYLKAPDFTIRYANDQFRRRFGDPEGHLCYRLIQNENEPCDFCPGFSKLEMENPLEWEWTFPDGRVYQLYDYPFIDTDGQELMLQLGIDITERKQAEEQLEQRHIELQTLSQAERQQRQLAESLAHAALVLNTALDMNQVLDSILEQIMKVIPSTAAAVMLLDSGTAYLARYRGIDQPLEGVRKMEAGLPLEDLPQMSKAYLDRQVHIVQEAELLPEWENLPGLEWVRSALIAPLIAEERVLGAIILGSRQPDFFIPENQSQLQAFSPHAVLAIQNARLFDEIQTGRVRLQALSRRLVEIQENERRWIARELHDEAGQALTSIKVGLRLLERQTQDPQVVQKSLSEMNKITDSVMETLHQLAVNLRPASLEHMGLVPALQQYLESFENTHALEIQFESLGLQERLPLDMETALYRIVQEALTNIARHANAGQAAVVVQRNPGKIILTIEDNGLGFDFNATQGNGHLGLLGMQERVEMLDGQLEIESTPGEGTTIYVEVPYAH